MEDVTLLSLVIPAYKQEKTIVKDIKNLDSVLTKLHLHHEIIVVVDGFVDNTYDLARKLQNAHIHIYGYKKNAGKGFAVKYGMSHAGGDVVGFIDAGMDLDPSEISIMLDLMKWNNADIMVGSKLHPDSKVNYPFSRRIPSWIYRTCIYLLFGFKVKDTQVGLKLFRKKVAKAVFPKILVKRFAFDVEVLAVAYALGYKRIYESPVKLDFNRYSSITIWNFWRVLFWMVWDTFAVFYRLRILHYYTK